MVTFRDISIFIHTYNGKEDDYLTGCVIHLSNIPTDDPIVFLLNNKNIDLSNGGFDPVCRGHCTVDSAIASYLLLKYKDKCRDIRIEDTDSLPFSYILEGDEYYEQYTPYIVKTMKKLMKSIRNLTIKIDTDLDKYPDEEVPFVPS